MIVQQKGWLAVLLTKIRVQGNGKAGKAGEAATTATTTTLIISLSNQLTVVSVPAAKPKKLAQLACVLQARTLPETILICEKTAMNIMCFLQLFYYIYEAESHNTKARVSFPRFTGFALLQNIRAPLQVHLVWSVEDCFEYSLPVEFSSQCVSMFLNYKSKSPIQPLRCTLLLQLWHLKSRPSRRVIPPTNIVPPPSSKLRLGNRGTLWCWV